jgi:hypothetical protein
LQISCAELIKGKLTVCSHVYSASSCVRCPLVPLPRPLNAPPSTT